jgi:hypothetical protein
MDSPAAGMTNRSKPPALLGILLCSMTRRCMPRWLASMLAEAEFNVRVDLLFLFRFLLRHLKCLGPVRKRLCKKHLTREVGDLILVVRLFLSWLAAPETFLFDIRILYHRGWEQNLLNEFLLLHLDFVLVFMVGYNLHRLHNHSNIFNNLNHLMHLAIHLL